MLTLAMLVSIMKCQNNILDCLIEFFSVLVNAKPLYIHAYHPDTTFFFFTFHHKACQSDFLNIIHIFLLFSL